MNPTFSIVIPTYGRPALLQECLEAVAKLNYPQNCFEVIVVDDGSPQPPEREVENSKPHLELKLICQAHGGPAKARNTGAAAAKMEYVVFTDDDCAPFPDWLQKLSERFLANPDHGIGGKVINRLQGNVYSTASQILTDYLYSYYNGKEPGTAKFFNSNNLAFPVKSFLEIGGFNTTFIKAAAEDREFCIRWLQSKRCLTYEAEAKVSHGHPLSLARFLKQHFNYGCGAFRLHQILAENKLPPIPMEPSDFYWDMFRFPFQSGVSNPAVLSALIAISQIANASGFFREKLRN